MLGPIFGSLTSVFLLRYGLSCLVFVEIALKNVFWTMPDAVTLMNTKGVIIKANHALVELVVTVRLN